MKYFSFLICLLFLASCNDDLDLGSTEIDINETIDTGPVTIGDVDLGTAVFSDVIYDENNEVMSDAVVAIYASSKRYSAITDAKGEYSISVPVAELPRTGFISLSIHKAAFIPENVVYKAPLTDGQVLGTGVESFALRACPECLNIGENSEELFHLGDDSFGGPENSQFQKSTDGVDVTLEVAGSVAFENLTLTFEAKGLQPNVFEDENHSSIQFMSGDEIVSEQFIDDDSAEDGSFTVYNFIVENSLPITSIKVITRDSPTTNFDDWEFTNLHLKGR